MDADVFKALLALDAYNRGYNAGIVLTGTKIGNATIVKDSEALKNNDGSRADIPAGFYAVSYSLTTGENIISYRGTDIISSWFWSDNPGGDFWNGWATGLGDPANKQAELALQFYQAVAGVGVDPRTANISLTGHSLGGGLAGFVGDLYGKKGTLFNNMAFEVAANDNAVIRRKAS